MELKSRSRGIRNNSVIRSNRTFMELKYQPKKIPEKFVLKF